jgi:ferric-dicitrate binding protein FerR (iron transport regulator)
MSARNRLGTVIAQAVTMVVSGAHQRRKAVVALAAMAACAVAYAQDQSLAAKVLTAQGRVSVLRHGEAWALFAGNSVRVGEVIRTGPDGYAQLQIADGSYFEVFADSQVIFRANPGNWRELVEVLLGKIRVYIQHFGGRPNPYRVHSPTAVISVRGTVFDVGVEPDTVTSVWVAEGLVAVQHRLLPAGKVVTVGAGQYLRILPNAPLAQAGVNKLGVAAKVAGAIRDTIYSLPRRSAGGGGGSPGGGGAGGGGGSLPTDTSAPPPPPQPTDREAPPPPPPPQ